ncbi:MAG: RNA polymerase sigma factor [Planctomycetota bacterium]
MSDSTAELTQAYSEYGPLVRAYAAGRLGNLHDADEVLQETFLAVAQNMAGFRTASSQKAWLIGIARNILRHRLRKLTLRRTADLEHDPVARSTNEIDPRVDDMKLAINRLPDAQREVLELRLKHECSYEEIAGSLHIPIGTVRSRIHAAVASLKEWAERTKEPLTTATRT